MGGLPDTVLAGVVALAAYSAFPIMPFETAVVVLLLLATLVLSAVEWEPTAPFRQELN